MAALCLSGCATTPPTSNNADSGEISFASSTGWGPAVDGIRIRAVVSSKQICPGESFDLILMYHNGSKARVEGPSQSVFGAVLEASDALEKTNHLGHEFFVRVHHVGEERLAEMMLPERKSFKRRDFLGMTMGAGEIGLAVIHVPGRLEKQGEEKLRKELSSSNRPDWEVDVMWPGRPGRWSVEVLWVPKGKPLSDAISLPRTEIEVLSRLDCGR